MNMQQTCDPDRLDAFVRGELSEEQESELRAHLDQCETCGE
jgi:anti-sigma factor RsiW